MTEGRTPAKSPLAKFDDTECIPDTPDEASASKAMHTLVHAAGVPDASVQSIPAPNATKTMSDPAVLPHGITTSMALSSSHAAVSRSRRMVPESPDEEGPPHESSQHAAASQPQFIIPMPHQEAASVAAPVVQQLRSQSHSQSLHLSLGMHSSGEGSHQPVNQAQPQAQPPAQAQAQSARQLSPEIQQNAAVVTQDATAVAACDAGTFILPAPILLSAEAGAAVQSLGHSAAISRPAHVSVVAPVRPTDAEAIAVAPASSGLAETAADLQSAAAIANAPVTHREADAAAAEGAVTPASSRQAHAQVVVTAGLSTGSPMNDSALMAALDSAERKFMQVLKLSVYLSALLSIQAYQ